MHQDRFSEEFGVENVRNSQLQEGTYAGEIELRGSQPGSFNVYQADGSDSTNSKHIDAEIVAVWDWLQISKEKTRKHIVYVFLGLLILWIIAGFVAFFALRDMSLLASAPLLTNPVAFVMGYYFGAEQSKGGKK